MKRRKEIDADPYIRPFSDWLREQGRGRSHEELGEALHTLISRVEDTGKKGSLTYVITVEPADKGIEGVVVVDEIKLRTPEHKRPASMYWIDDEGNLSREDPRQLTFESLREVPPPPGVDPETGELKDVR